MADNPFEIPQQMRDVAEQNLKQAHAAYEQLMDFMTKAMGARTAVLPSNPMAAVLKDVQDRVAAMAKQNAESVFALAEKIAKAQNFQEIVTLQTRFAQDQMQAFAAQTEELFSVIGEAVPKSERGTMGPSMDAMPSNLMTVDFKDVQDRALHIARENAESVFAFAGKISNALTPQDIVTLQTQFAQDQMQAFAAQTQELQRLMGETLQKLQRGMSVIFRSLRTEDKELFKSFIRSLPRKDNYYLMVDVHDDQAINRWMNRVESGEIIGVIALEGDQMVGYCNLHTNNLPWLRHVGEIRMSVSTAHRGRRIGKALAREIFSIARARGLKKIWARMAVSQYAAENVFKRLGFRTEAVLSDFVTNENGLTEDLVIMSHNFRSHF